MEGNSIVSVAPGVMGLVMDLISFFICGWLGFLGLAVGICDLCFRSGFVFKIPALVSVISGASF